MTEIYKNAFQEVYVILNNLEKDAYSKIPKDILNMIEKQRNVNHIFCFSNDFDNLKNILLPETKAILFSFLMDYLATPEQRDGMIKLQAREEMNSNYEKNIKYSVDIFAQKNKSETSQNIDDEINNSINKNNGIIKYQDDLFRKIWNMIISLFRKK
ncbi:MAG: hypothetical protein J6D03_03035 [Clostridia bacterium]|nr:hypothetical protein [Clostridia bacterium]